MRRPIQVMMPLRYIGKEIERRAQEGEEIGVFEGSGPIQYQSGRTLNTRAADPGLILRAKRFSKKRLMRESRISQHSLDRFLNGERVHPRTRARLAEIIEKLEKQARKSEIALSNLQIRKVQDNAIQRPPKKKAVGE
jgi:hypothetical protein